MFLPTLLRQNLLFLFCGELIGVYGCILVGLGLQVRAVILQLRVVILQLRAVFLQLRHVFLQVRVGILQLRHVFLQLRVVILQLRPVFLQLRARFWQLSSFHICAFNLSCDEQSLNYLEPSAVQRRFQMLKKKASSFLAENTRKEDANKTIATLASKAPRR